MIIRKRIATHRLGNNKDEYTITNGFVIGNYDHSFTAYSELVAQAKKDFPKLTDAIIQLGIITESSFMKGYAIVKFALLPETTHPDYTPYVDGRIDFRWV